MINKKILLIFHLNFLSRDRGCSVYVYEIIKHLKTQGFSIDFFTNATVMSKSDIAEFYKINAEEKLIDNIYYIEDSATDRFFWATQYDCEEFNKVVNRNKYDYIFMHYIQWANLISNQIPETTQVVYCMHDSNFIQSFYNNPHFYEQSDFNRELRLLERFDKIVFISNDELIFWKHFYPEKKFYFLPHIVKQRPANTPQIQRDIDILFLGAYNPYNVEALEWFLNDIYPKLKTKINFTICGKVLTRVSKDIENKIKKLNISTIDFCEDLSTLYKRTKIVIVPMCRGTGMKIKTIEAMSYGIPIVSTYLGVDGFPDKTCSGICVTDNTQEFANYIDKLCKDMTFYKKTQILQNDYFASKFSIDTVTKSLKEVFKYDISSRKMSSLDVHPIQQTSNNGYKVKLFSFIPLCSKKTKGQKLTYKIFGIPVLTIRTKKNGLATKYYFCGIPIMQVSRK